MKRTCTSLALLIALFALTASAAWAGDAKVQVCHVPPGNPANFHTITISENALQAHLAHGDLAGACFAHCDTLCSDGNACTIDACDASEHCVNTHPPVNCDDSSSARPTVAIRRPGVRTCRRPAWTTTVHGRRLRSADRELRRPAGRVSRRTELQPRQRRLPDRRRRMRNPTHARTEIASTARTATPARVCQGTLAPTARSISTSAPPTRA